MAVANMARCGLAVTTRARSPPLPEIPGMAEATGSTAYESSNWHGLMLRCGPLQLSIILAKDCQT